LAIGAPRSVANGYLLFVLNFFTTMVAKESVNSFPAYSGGSNYAWETG
jgi:hypothetical protein